MQVKISDDVLKKIRQIEICARRLLNGSLVGESSSAIKGSGFEFDQIRDYQLGDDIRCIDWRGSARANKLLVKQYIEERNRTIIIVVDISASGKFSSGEKLRCDVIAEVAAILALVGSYGKDAVGLILFADSVELCMPPAQGKSHIRMILEKIYTHVPRGTRTNIQGVLDYINTLSYRDGMVFLISDFIDQQSFERSLRSTAKKYDVVALRCLDMNEYDLPNVGFLTLRDLETGQLSTIDMRVRQSKGVHGFLSQRMQDQLKTFNKYSVDCVDIIINKPFMGNLIRFFRRRMTY